MATKRTRPSPRPVSGADVTRLKAMLALYLERLELLEHTVEINVKRIAAMQAEIDFLRASRQRT
jgi:uncharacterized small protein (DUF1192 family)